MLKGVSSTMETSLAFSSSNTGGVEPNSGLPFTLESHLCHSSSFCTWSSQDMEEEQPSSMASLKAICWASDSFAILPHEGWGGVGSLWSQGPDGSCGDPPLGIWDAPFLTLWLRCSLTPCLLLDSLRDLPSCFVISGPHLCHSWVLLGPWEGLWWSPEAIWVCLSSSHLHLLFPYWDLLSIPSKKGAQTCTMWSWTP